MIDHGRPNPHIIHCRSLSWEEADIVPLAEPANLRKITRYVCTAHYGLALLLQAWHPALVVSTIKSSLLSLLVASSQD